jgi:hypothetical protein
MGQAAMAKPEAGSWALHSCPNPEPAFSLTAAQQQVHFKRNVKL